MPIIKPATPGFLVTLGATVLLAIVSFSVPYFHSVFFLKASLAAEGQSGDITFGTLGYCVILNGNTTCSKPSVGYELNINGLVGDEISFLQIPTVVVKWLTYALVLHIVALVLAGVSAIFGLLAHFREMSMSCFSSCIAGFGASIALLAFIFDLALFFIAKSRLNKVKGGSASFGNAVWLTLAAALLLMFSGCFYGIGRCCIKRRPRNDGTKGPIGGEAGNSYADSMRLDAVKAEADRKARQKQGEGGLPAFHEYDPSQPLRARVDGDSVYLDDEDPYHDSTAYRQHNQAPAGLAGGYVPGAPGGRAIDEFHSPPRTNSSYPPTMHRTNSEYTQGGPGYAQSQNSVAPMSPTAEHQYLSTVPYQGHDQYASNYGQEYGHALGGTSYHSAATHQPQASQYDVYNPPSGAPHDPYNAYNSPPQPQHYAEPAFNPETYNSTGMLAGAGMAPRAVDHYNNNAPYQPPQSPPHQQPERSYTLGGGDVYAPGYGTNQVPDHTAYNDSSYHSPPRQMSHSPPQFGQTFAASPAHINTNLSSLSPPQNTSPVKGPRTMGSPSHQQYSDSPPGYDNAGPAAAAQPNWGEKR